MRAALCMSLALLAGCGPGVWVPAIDGADGALLSVTGTSSDDVWTAGGDAGEGPTVLHWNGDVWQDVDLRSRGDLWWVWQPSADDVWFVGAAGRVLRFTPSSGVVEPHTLDEEVTLYGIWGASTQAVWAVGGIPTESANASALWFFDGTAWTSVTLPEGLSAAAALYKVWGSSKDDVWVVGTGGVIGHFDGTSWTQVPSPTDRDLFTVHGTGPDEAYAVGGFGTATILRWDGTAWSDESEPRIPAFPGVFTHGDTVWTAGNQGAIWSREDGVWAADPRGDAGRADLHAIWVDPDDGVWAVGGSIASFPLTDGVLAYGGKNAPDLLTP